MKRALISDVHGNLEALEAVLADIRKKEISEIYCLGDIIGYGPNPVECIDRIMQVCKVTILGNHDQGALFDPDGFNKSAERAIFWTRDQLENSRVNIGNQTARWEYLGELPRSVREEGLLFVHGSPRHPLSEYVFPEDIYIPKKMEKLFSLIEKTCFQGHTHVPGVFTQSLNFVSPDEVGYKYRWPSEKIMVNVGSVGQPRDGDRRACYVVLDDEYINFCRVDYPAEVTRDKIYAIPDLDNNLGDRLLLGR